MMDQDEDDDLLQRDLAEAWADVRPLVDGVSAAGKGVFAWRTIQEDLLLAELSFDSAQDSGAALTRAASIAPARALVFSVPLQSVEVEVLADRLAGQFVPPAPGTVMVESEEGPGVPVEVDEFGFFLIDAVPRGRVRFHCAVAGTRFVSSWVHL
jgi:hypothetical protein